MKMNTLTEIIKQASAVCNLRVDEVLSKSREQDLVFCRAAVAKIARGQGMIPRRIGEALNRDRSTVYNLLSVAEESHVQKIIKDVKRGLSKQGAVAMDIFRFTQPTIFLAEEQ
jgi:chromosomal replication initiation ATPase DnaA